MEKIVINYKNQTNNRNYCKCLFYFLVNFQPILMHLSLLFISIPFNFCMYFEITRKNVLTSNKYTVFI
ncbi:unnamed protein product [Schistosoma margrebowiei]|uniref:Uncharacterized protein n=1 Tax=Schistosoma margrebowiei TaxID=48269 RepID=A0A183LUD8_9TREM|nr:unnamed protein product [Schistosoma margrebowiei]